VSASERVRELQLLEGKRQRQAELLQANARAAQAELERVKRSGDAAAVAAATSALGAVERELREVAAALDDVRIEIDNAREDALEESSAADPLPPRSDYPRHEIVARLSQYHQRATYGAVGALLGASRQYVRGWFSGSESRENSFVVSEITGEPTNYPAGCVDPHLRESPRILRDGAELLEWLQTHPARR
jgi:hypothetical protein